MIELMNYDLKINHQCSSIIYESIEIDNRKFDIEQGITARPRNIFRGNFKEPT